MTKAEVALEVSKQTGIDKKDAMAVIESMMGVIKKANTENKGVFLRGWGTFGVTKRREKIARNISQNTSMILKAHFVPTFKPSKVFKSEVGRKVKI